MTGQALIEKDENTFAAHCAQCAKKLPHKAFQPRDAGDVRLPLA